MKKPKEKILSWRVNTTALFREIVEGSTKNETEVFRQPLRILSSVLGEVAFRALELNDPKLNALMCRLALYEESDPYSPEYDEKATDKAINSVYNKKV